MEGTNIICSFLIYIFLLIVFIFNYYRNINIKKNKDNKVLLKDISPTMNFYCFDLLSSTKLFYITILELVNQKYFTLYMKDNNLYIKNNHKEITSSNYRKEVYEYIFNIDDIKVEDLDYKIRTDCGFSNVLNRYINILKNNTISTIGRINKFYNYIYSLIITFIYSLQVFYFITNDINLVGRFLISLPFTYFTLVISDLLKNKIGILSKKKYIVLFIISIIVSLITSNIWNNDTNNDYLIFHFLMGIFTFLYPMLIVINIYSIKTNYIYRNKIQKDLIEQININQKKNYLYVKVLKLKTDIKDEIIDLYFEILDI